MLSYKTNLDIFLFDRVHDFFSNGQIEAARKAHAADDTEGVVLECLSRRKGSASDSILQI